MAASTTMPNEDALIQRVMSQKKELFFSSRRNMTEEQRQLEWEQKVAHLASTRGPTQQTMPTLEDKTIDCFNTTQSELETQAMPPKRRRIGDGTPQIVHQGQAAPEHSQDMLRRRSNIPNGVPVSRYNMVSTPSTVPVSSWLATDPPFAGFNSVERIDNSPASESGQRLMPAPIDVTSFEVSDFVEKNADQSPADPLPSFASPRKPFLHTRNSSSTYSSSPYSDPIASPVDFLTNPTSTAMSRQNSKASNSFCNGMDRMRIAPSMSRNPSGMSRTSDNAPFSSQPATNTGYEISSPSPADSNQHNILSHLGGAADDGMISDAFGKHVRTSKNELAVVMTRTGSAESNGSNASRLVRRSQEQVALAARKLHPASRDPSVSAMSAVMSRQTSQLTSHDMSRTSSTGSQNPQVAIPRLNSVQRISDKLKCDKCDKHPEGFRGEHELRRHEKSTHDGIKKVWICIDASRNQDFLKGCEHCKNFKRYNAYYNAAAHLRRRHFNAKPVGQRKKGRLLPQEKRGGKGGGTSPAMSVLKEWMYEFEAFMDGAPVDEADLIYSRPTIDEPISAPDVDSPKEAKPAPNTFDEESHQPGPAQTQHDWAASQFAGADLSNPAMPVPPYPDDMTMYAAPASPASPVNDPRLYTLPPNPEDLDWADIYFNLQD